MGEATRLLAAMEAGDPHAAEELLPLVYEELRRLASRKLAHEKPGQTLQATALVHEAYLRLVDTANAQRWNSRGHFYCAAAEAMRRILVERARQKKTLKAGGEFQRIDLPDVHLAAPDSELDILELNDALNALEREDKRQAELVKLRFFVGLTSQQAADALGVSVSTAENDWVYARCWLRVQMGSEPPKQAY